MTILEEAQKLVDGDRKKDYGNMDESFDRIAALWSAYLSTNIDKFDVAKMMILLKVSRAKDTNHRDSYVDIAGYVECVDQLLSYVPPIKTDRNKKLNLEELSTSVEVQDSDVFVLLEKKLNLKKQGFYFLGLCPFRQEKTPSFRVNFDLNEYHCLSCGANGEINDEDFLCFLDVSRPNKKSGN